MSTLEAPRFSLCSPMPRHAAHGCEICTGEALMVLKEMNCNSTEARRIFLGVPAQAIISHLRESPTVPTFGAFLAVFSCIRDATSATHLLKAAREAGVGGKTTRGDSRHNNLYTG